MKPNCLIIFFMLLIVLLSACNEDVIDQKMVTPDLKGDIQLSADIQDVSVLIFGEENEQYKYQKTINIEWPEKTTTSTNLQFGYYKFLFIKTDQSVTDILPKPLLPDTQLENIHIYAREDQSKGDPYVKPVDEIFMPETKDLAEKVYSIQGNELIKNKLTRAVSQIELKIKRGIWENGQLVDSLPYTGNQNILNFIDKIEMDIEGVGEYVTISGSKGNKKTFLTMETSAATLFPTGFASFEGPFLLPPETADTSIDFSIIPKSSGAYPILNKTLPVVLEKNKRTEITLWLSSIYQFIEITVETTPISDEQDGNVGLWN